MSETKKKLLFLIPSTLGVLLFMIPILVNKTWTIAVKLLADVINGVIGGFLPLLCVMILTISAVLALLAQAKTAVIFMGKDEDRAAQIDAANRLVAAGAQVIAVSLYTPRCLDDMPAGVWKVCAWQYERLALDALIGFLKRS